MIRITIDLIPMGWQKPENLGVIEIVNDGMGTKARGNYYANAYDKGGRLWKSSTISNFPRTRLLVFDLLYRLLKEMIGERND